MMWISCCSLGSTDLSELFRSVFPWSQSSSGWGWTGPESPVGNDVHRSHANQILFAFCCTSVLCNMTEKSITQTAEQAVELYLVDVFRHLVDFFGSRHFSTFQCSLQQNTFLLSLPLVVLGFKLYRSPETETRKRKRKAGSFVIIYNNHSWGENRNL